MNAAQYKPAHVAREFGFDDDGLPVPSVGFDYEALDPRGALSADDERAIRCEVIIRMLQMLGRGGDAKHIGRRVLFLAHLVNADRCRQKELAQKMGLSAGRVSQALKRARADFSMLSRA